MSISDRQKSAKTLIELARRGDYLEVEALTELSLDLDVSDDNGYTAVTHAAANGHLQVVKLLLAKGARAEPHAVGMSWDSPLTMAVKNKHHEIAQVLIDAGADPLRLLDLPRVTQGTGDGAAASLLQRLKKAWLRAGRFKGRADDR